MPMVWLALKINILIMEQAFQMGYKEGEFFFYVSPTNLKERRNVLLPTSMPRVLYGMRRMITLNLS